MNKTFTIDGQTAVTVDQDNKVVDIQFMPDDEFAPVFEQGSQTHGWLQMLRSGEFYYAPNKAKLRANSILLRKAAHGRISATRDEAIQLTLKVFKREGLDIRETIRREALELINNVRL